MIVVAAALERDGVVLAAHRREPAGWEFPGGKVEPDETEADALVRECREELGVTVTVGPFVGASAIADGVELRLYRAAVRDGTPRPLVDHDELRWLAPADLTALDWLPADRSLVDLLAP